MPLDALGTPAGSVTEDVRELESVDPEEVVEEEEESEETPDEESEEEEPEPEEEETEEEEEPEPIAFERPTVKALKEAYPDIFKKFPSLKDSYFREIEFTRIFPSVEDAREAVQENEAFSGLSDSALEGDPSPLLESLEKTDKKAFEVFNLSYLPTLYKRDQQMYQAVVLPVIENLFRSAYKSSNEDTRKAAVELAKFIFDDDGEAIAQGKKTLSKVKDVLDEQKKVRDARDQNISKQFQTAYGDVSAKIGKNLESMILKDFDPNKAYSPFVRKQLAAKVAERIFKQLESDEGHKSVMANRWKKAKQNGYTNEDRSKIVSTFLARAKSLIPSTSEKVRSLANGRSKEDRTPARRPPEARRENLGGRPPSRSNGAPDKAAMRKMTDLQILEMD